ncbi:hypothetical protein UCD39_24700 [Nitrospirillum sp. BR 11752]|uniref:hypothetical protein n=1 Tax=Nitrospirillum sp. BR 11752 TaxID=3104293 RepID=UPI002EA59E0B|nr:hypothetical protein [Nitrospirillum sp. BR 11752]
MTPPRYDGPLFIPTYQSFKGERWDMDVVPLILCPGYWSDATMVRDMATLVRRRPGQPTHVWMSMTPFEIESQEIGCRLAWGRTVVMGMGMGWAACNAAINPAVTEVMVVEYDSEVLAAVEQSGIFRQLPPEAAAKISIRQGDAHRWRPEDGVACDTLMADIWLGLHGAGREKEVKAMAANTGAKGVYFWGQEMNIAWRLKELGLPLDDAGIAHVMGEWNLPLLGPGQPDYADKMARAAQRRLQSPLKAAYSDGTPPAV